MWRAMSPRRSSKVSVAPSRNVVASVIASLSCAMCLPARLFARTVAATGKWRNAMADHADLSLPERLASLWDHLGLRGAHVATQMPSDVSGFVARHADRVAALTLCVPVRLDPAGFAAVADRLLMISGSRGLSAEATQRAAGRLPAARRIVLDDYEAPGWADVVADRATTIAAALREMAARSPATELSGPARSGAHAGISYQICGQGPALVLLPFFLARHSGNRRFRSCRNPSPSLSWVAAILAASRRWRTGRVGVPIRRWCAAC